MQGLNPLRFSFGLSALAILSEPSPAPPQTPIADAAQVCLRVRRLTVAYAGQPALTDISLDIPRHQVTAFIGPSGCGKTTLLRSFNRMNELVESASTAGLIELEGRNILAPEVDAAQLRRQVGMVFQRPNPFPKSIYDNVAYGLRIQLPSARAADLDLEVEAALRSAALWDEVADRLRAPALDLSGGQQQRLVIARAIAVKPAVLLLDEPASALDPISTLKIEQLIHELKSDYTIIIVTHDMQQAARVSDFTAFLNAGRLVEYGPAEAVFTNPRERLTEDYITGRRG